MSWSVQVDTTVLPVGWRLSCGTCAAAYALVPDQPLRPQARDVVARHACLVEEAPELQVPRQPAVPPL
ncbi:MAG: hypothetical protein JWO22_444 [Frankiales bacterium]|nr:hypothetical protein [Frankiales bacterium]